jgi:hypothetical protein
LKHAHQLYNEIGKCSQWESTGRGSNPGTDPWRKSLVGLGESTPSSKKKLYNDY